MGQGKTKRERGRRWRRDEKGNGNERGDGKMRGRKKPKRARVTHLVR